MAPRRPGDAAVFLRRGMLIGAASSTLFLGLLWAWPTSLAMKSAMSAFMLPVALAASWGGRKGWSLVQAGLLTMPERHSLGRDA